MILDKYGTPAIKKIILVFAISSASISFAADNTLINSQPEPIEPNNVVSKENVPTLNRIGQNIDILALLAFLVGAAYGVHRSHYFNKRELEIITDEFSPSTFFLDIHHGLASGDLEKLSLKLTPEMLKMAEKVISSDSYKRIITTVSYDSHYVKNTVVSTHYEAEDKLNCELIDEIWDIKWVDGRWMLSGITALNSIPLR